MKLLIAFLLSSATCFAGEMISVTDADIKRPSQDHLRIREEILPKLDLTKERDRKALDLLEVEMYRDAMLQAGEPFFRQTKLKRGDDWRELWQSRQQDALGELRSAKEQQESLKRAFTRLSEFTGPREATVLERVVKAKFGGDLVWILMVRSEGEDSLLQALHIKGEALLDHETVIAVRAWDQKLISRALCN